MGWPQTYLHLEKNIEYGQKDIYANSLGIGGYESSFCADLESYLFEKCNNEFREVMWKGIYREDGLLVLEGGN